MQTEQNTAVAVDKKELKTFKRKKRNKTFLRILAGLLAVILVFVGVTATITVIGLNLNIKKAKEYPKAEITEYTRTDKRNLDGTYITGFVTDKEFKVMQLTDIHLGGGWMSIGRDARAINAVAAMMLAEKPDFVVVTGDVAYPVPFQAGTFNNKNGAKLFAEFMEQLGVYWTIAFGNHDTEAYSYYSREQIYEFYKNGGYEHCLLDCGPEDVDGVGNQVFNIINTDGVVTRTIFVMDSHSYVDGDYLGIYWKYDNIHENQIEWYKRTLNGILGDNKQLIASLSEEKAEQYKEFEQCVPSSVYQHIPLTEYRTAWKEYIDNGEKDTADTKYFFGGAGESKKVVYSGIHDDNMFETMLELGSTDSVFCGHDHYNDFSVEYKGVRFTYSKSIDFLAYPGISKLGTQRGCTIINYKPDGTMNITSESLYQEKYSSLLSDEKVTMQEITNQSFVLDE